VSIRTTVVVLALLTVFVQPAVAQQPPAPPTLTGESFVGFGDITGNCSETSTATFTFTASGTASGPYPGTFEESGTYTIAPTAPGGSGSLLSFEATFTIESPVGTVTGSKRFDPNQPPQVGRCVINNVGSPGTFEVLWEATLEVGGCTYTDRGNGTTSLILDERVPPGEQPPFGEFFRLSELTNPELLECVGGPDATVVVLTPPTALNPAGSQHTVTATATTATSGPAEGVKIRFSILGASDADGTCTTDSQGQCTFTYTGPDLPGADLITGCADNDDSGTTDPGEPCGEATKIWMLPATTPGQVTGGGWITVDGNRVSFGFNAQSAAAAATARGNCNVIDHATRAQIKCKTVDSLVVTATHATFSGQATVDGTTTSYRIDVDDLGEPGLADTFKIQTDSGYTAAGTLRGGNIQIHR
jgi:hypothetical protein